MVKRPGATQLGCLTWILLVSLTAYAGIHIGAPYMRYLRYSDAISEEVRYATFRNDDAIRTHIWAAADSIGMPESAYHLTVERTTGSIHVYGSYDDEWVILTYFHLVHFIIEQKGTI